MLLGIQCSDAGLELLLGSQPTLLSLAWTAAPSHPDTPWLTFPRQILTDFSALCCKARGQGWQAAARSPRAAPFPLNLRFQVQEFVSRAGTGEKKIHSRGNQTSALFSNKPKIRCKLCTRECLPVMLRGCCCLSPSFSIHQGSVYAPGPQTKQG